FVLMVCTETYLRRVDGEEAPGMGYGVLWEARLIKQHLYNSGSVSQKFVPALFTDGRSENIPAPIAGASIFTVDNPRGYESLLRLLTNQPSTPAPLVGSRKTLPPRPRRTLGSEEEAVPPSASLPHPGVEDVFVGRQAERDMLRGKLFPASGPRRP